MSGNDQDSNEWPITQMAAAAAQMHEMFCAYVDAGFTERQALYLCGRVIVAGSRSDDEAP